MKDHIYTYNAVALCRTSSFAAAALASRNGCQRCQARLDTLIHAIKELSNLRGFSELYAADKKVRAAVDFVFADQQEGCDHAADESRGG